MSGRSWNVQVFVFFPEEDKVGVKTIKTFAERMRNEGVNRAVMVTQVNMTPFARQCLQEMAPKYYIEVVRLLWQRLRSLSPILWHLHCLQCGGVAGDGPQVLHQSGAASLAHSQMTCCIVGLSKWPIQGPIRKWCGPSGRAVAQPCHPACCIFTACSLVVWQAFAIARPRVCT